MSNNSTSFGSNVVVMVLVCINILVTAILFAQQIVQSAFSAGSATPTPAVKPIVIVGDRGEASYMSNIKQITFEGTNAEAYWSRDSSKFIFQGIRKGYPQCDQIFTMNADGSNIRMISDGRGRTTCSYYLNDGEHFVYASTMDSLGVGCPPNPDSAFGYVWPIYKTMDIYKANAKTGKTVQQLTNSGHYDAEATLSPDGNSMVFTTARDGDLELYSMDTNGTNVKRLTFSPGYDGGAFYSNNGKMIVWRANRPRGQKLTDYLNLLNLGLVEPVATEMEIYVMNADGSNQRRITKIGGASFAPSFLPDDSGVIFASNLGRGSAFHLYTIDLNGQNMRQITTRGTFNLFPLFSPNGKYLAWESDYNSTIPHEMNVFVGTWNGYSYKA